MQTPILLALSPLFLLGKPLHWLELRSRRRVTRRAIAEDRGFNYGATKSIREAASEGAYRRYFQKLDKEMYMKMVERGVLDSIIDFLDGKGVDTSDLKERRTTILNSGVIVSGGSIEANNLAVGRQARAGAASGTPAAA